MADLRTLHPQLAFYARHLLTYGKTFDGRLVVTSARRDRSKQARLYQKWLSGESTIPAAPPGDSLHEHGLAFDLARVGMDPHADPLLSWLGRVWTHWGGRYGGTADPVHFQVPS